METKKRRTSEETQALRDRVKKVREVTEEWATKRGIVQLFCDKYPEYDSYVKGMRVARIYSGQLVDEDITLKLEELATANI